MQIEDAPLPAFVLAAVDSAQRVPIHAGTHLCVGRAEGLELVLTDPSVSRIHAEIVCDATGIRLRDLGARNGTFVDGTRLGAAAVPMEPGSVVTFGTVSFRLEAAAPAAAPVIVRERRVRTEERATRVLQRLRVDAVSASPPSARESARAAMRLALLAEVAKGLARTPDVSTLLDKIADLVVRVMDADQVALLLVDERGMLVPKVARDARGELGARPVPQSIVRRVVAEQVAVLSTNAIADSRFAGHSVLLQGVRSAMCAPLVGSEGRVEGVLYVDNLTQTHSFDTEDLDFLVAFSGIAAVALENSRFVEHIRRQTLIQSSFERYFAPALAERIAAAPESVRLGGERQPVAVLFNDIRGFTPIAERLRADEMAQLLSEFFTEMVECVFRHGGTLDKFIGDSVLAQWGAPIGRADDADRALLAAMDMVRAVEALGRKWSEQGRPRFQIGIGLNYGEVFAGNIGSERRLEYTVIGDAVNVAARLCAVAGPGEILLTDELRRALAAEPALEPRPPMQLKGKSQAVPVWGVRS